MMETTDAKASGGDSNFGDAVIMHNGSTHPQWRQLDKHVSASKISYMIVGNASIARFRAILPAHPHGNF